MLFFIFSKPIAVLLSILNKLFHINISDAAIKTANAIIALVSVGEPDNNQIAKAIIKLMIIQKAISSIFISVILQRAG